MTWKIRGYTEPKERFSANWRTSVGLFTYETGIKTDLPYPPYFNWVAPVVNGYRDTPNRSTVVVYTNSLSSAVTSTSKVLFVRARQIKKPFTQPSVPRYNPPKPLVRKPLKERTYPSLRPLPYANSPHSQKFIDRFNSRVESILKAREKSWLTYKRKSDLLWNARVRRRNEQIATYESNYKKRMMRYATIKAKYDAMQVKLRIPKYKLVRSKQLNRPNQPYERVFEVNYGFSGYWYANVYCDFIVSGNYAYFNPVEGPYLYKTTGQSGYIGQGPVTLTGEPLDYMAYSDLNNLLARADDHARGKLAGKLSDQKAHVGMIIAERAQTIGMVRSAIQALTALVDAKKSLTNPSRAGIGIRSITKKVSDHYLAMKFGVEPLLLDVKGGAEKLAQILARQSNDKIVIRSVSRFSDSKKSSVDNWYFIDNHEVFVQVKTSYVLEYKISSGALVMFQELGLVNPAEIFWELTPWSFVVDWFLPVGNWINSWTADCGLEFVTGTKVVTTTTTYVSRRNYLGKLIYGDGGMNRRDIGEVTGRKTTELKKREVLTAPPVTTNFPLFKSPISGQHIALSLALLYQKIHDKIKRIH